MKTQNLVKKTGALILTICLMLTMMVGVIPAQVQAAEGDSHTLYFLNSNGWTDVGAYIYNSTPAELLGSWGTTTATAATELGENWVKIDVPGTPTYNIILYNKGDENQRTDLYISSLDNLYLTANGQAYATQAEAEAAMNAPTYELYFLNTNGWEGVGAHAYYENESGEIVKPMGEWGSAIGTAATELGENWVAFSATQTPPYSVIIYNTADDTQRFELYIDAADKIYVTADGQAHTSQLAAEVAMGVAETHALYFLNTDGWESVGAHAYYENENGEVVKPMGEWGSAIGTAATELGENWVKFSATQTPPYSVIIYNAADDTQRLELYIDTADKIYVTKDAQAYTSKAAAESAMGIEQPSYPVYFLNSDEWAEVGAYIYGDQGELLGGWGSTVATASDLGGNWLQVNVPAEAPYNIIFFNTTDPDNQRAELYIDAAEKDYVTVNAEAFTSQADAEASLESEPPTETTEPSEPEETYPVYFLNSNEWAEVGVYIYGDQGELLGGWGTTTAVASDLGGDWLQVNVPAEAPYNIIFFNKTDDTQRAELYIDAAEKDYVTVNAVAFTSQAEAEASMVPVTTYDLYFLNAYNWEGVGAYAYVTAEDGTNAEPLGGWGTSIATAAEELGGKWMKVSATQEPPYSVIFYNTADDTQRVEYYIDAADKVYATVKNAAFASQAEAEAWNNSGVELFNMTLKDDLGINFYLNVDSALAPNTVANIKVAGADYSSASLAGMTVNDDGYYVISADLAAAQMTEEVAVELWVGDKNLYYNTYTVRSYADYILTDVNNEFDDTTKALVRQMLEYGAAAQTYFGHNTGAYANAGLESVEQTAVPGSADTEMVCSGELEGISYYGATLVFTSKNAVRFYFEVTGDINSYTFKVGEKVYEPVLKDGKYYVEIADINPQQLNSAITLTVNDTLSVTYSPMNYIVRMSAKGSANLKTLLLALYNYYLAACKV